mmetsp:Transcript_66384/g.210014  ORF Transcript_66384/g.210014 Transcript_66384/m.210014 type:complete len:202 (+) Transcript_66384:1018-1623(+)
MLQQSAPSHMAVRMSTRSFFMSGAVMGMVNTRRTGWVWSSEVHSRRMKALNSFQALMMSSTGPPVNLLLLTSHVICRRSLPCAPCHSITVSRAAARRSTMQSRRAGYSNALFRSHSFAMPLIVWSWRVRNDTVPSSAVMGSVCSSCVTQSKPVMSSSAQTRRVHHTPSMAEGGRSIDTDRRARSSGMDRVTAPLSKLLGLP